MKRLFSTRLFSDTYSWQRSEDIAEQHSQDIAQIRARIYHIAWYFVIYSFIGWCWEVFYAILERHRLENRGFLFGPLCPIYGVMILSFVLFYHYCKKRWLVFFISSVVAVTVTEYITGTFIEYYFGRRLWSYIGWPLNVRGYICIPVSIFWGLGAVLVVKFLHPQVRKLVEKIPQEIGKWIICGIVFCIALDLATTISTSLGFRPYTQISEFFINNFRIGP